MKDRLPELLGDAGARAELGTVRAHVASCDSCRSELALLRAVRDAHPAPRIDVARIAAAIPPYGRTSAWARATHSAGVRIAASFVIMIGLAATVQFVRKDQARRNTVAARAEVARLSGELAVGTSLSDLSEADLQDLLRDLGEIEAVTPAEEDIVVIPAVDRSGT